MAGVPFIKIDELFICIYFLLFFLPGTVYASCNVTFEWTPNKEAYIQGYRIHYGTKQNGPYDQIFNAGNPVAINGKIRVTISDLDEGTWYFVATAYDGDYESEYSAEVSFTCQESSASHLSPPDTLTAIPADSIDLSWSSVSGAVGYNVYRSTTSGSGYVKINGSSPVTGTSYVDQNTNPGTTYYYVVTSVDSAGKESAYSKEAHATEPGGNKAPTLTSINAVPNPAGNPRRNITFTVSASDSDGDPLSYRINFGDGTSSSSGSTVNHAYNTKGTYNVTVTVSDNHGHSVSKSIQMVVNDNKPVKVTGVQAK